MVRAVNIGVKVLDERGRGLMDVVKSGGASLSLSSVQGVPMNEERKKLLQAKERKVCR